MKIAAVTVSALLVVALAGCKPSGDSATGSVRATPAQPGETPAPVMTDAEASSAMAMTSAGDSSAP